MAPSRNAGIAALASGRRAAVGVRPRGPGSRELAGEYGLGALLATVVWEELGDTRRFTSSRHAARHTGLDVSVYDSDGKQQSLPTLTLPGVDGLHASLREQVAV
jgi:transposase